MCFYFVGFLTRDIGKLVAVGRRAKRLNSVSNEPLVLRRGEPAHVILARLLNRNACLRNRKIYILRDIRLKNT